MLLCLPCISFVALMTSLYPAMFDWGHVFTAGLFEGYTLIVYYALILSLARANTDEIGSVLYQGERRVMLCGCKWSFASICSSQQRAFVHMTRCVFQVIVIKPVFLIAIAAIDEFMAPTNPLKDKIIKGCKAVNGVSILLCLFMLVSTTRQLLVRLQYRFDF